MTDLHEQRVGGDAELDRLLADVYECTRVWEAWEYGTMTEADFTPAAESDLRGALIAWRDAAVAADRRAQTGPCREDPDPVTMQARPVPESATTKARAGRSFDPTIGYAAVVANGSMRDSGREAVIEAMRAIDPAAELARFTASANPAAEVLLFKIVASLGKITTWEQATAAYEAGREADRRRSAEAAARRDRTQAVADALKEYGIATAYRSVVPGGEGVTILIGDAERLLELLSRVRPPGEPR